MPKVNMIRGFVHNEDGRLLQAQAGQREQPLLTLRQRLDALFHDVISEEETTRDLTYLFHAVFHTGRFLQAFDHGGFEVEVGKVLPIVTDVGSLGDRYAGSRARDDRFEERRLADPIRTAHLHPRPSPQMHRFLHLRRSLIRADLPNAQNLPRRRRSVERHDEVSQSVILSPNVLHSILHLFRHASHGLGNLAQSPALPREFVRLILLGLRLLLQLSIHRVLAFDPLLDLRLDEPVISHVRFDLLREHVQVQHLVGECVEEVLVVTDHHARFVRHLNQALQVPQPVGV
mmetsp:Transcript_11785/g.25506  ORF Transcript_11785/g.25506 Transcript_11785/m.25506 type:complete len:288 (-) Transcript_11785:804-1667(-)